MADNKLISLTIDGQVTQAAAGTTIHAAAAALGIQIPTLCWKPGFHSSGSCMVCAVQVTGRANLIPSCTAVVEEGLRIETGTDEVHAARRTALELLLSDHGGDCEGLCQRGCPAGLDIPAMIRAMGSDRMAVALEIVWDTIAFPAILGRICPAPCEKICRRGAADAPVSICLLKRRVGDWALAQDPPIDPACKPKTGKRVAIIGAGPAGLAAAFELLRAGHECTLFDDHSEPGGGLLQVGTEGRLPDEVRRGEIGRLTRLGAQWRLGERVDLPGGLAGLRADYHAVILALGTPPPPPPGGGGGGWPIMAGADWNYDRTTGSTGPSGVFAAGGMIHPLNLAVRALADGRRVARVVDRWLKPGEAVGAPHRYAHQAGHLSETEIQTLMGTAHSVPRREPVGDGFTPGEAIDAAGRCLQCDCRRKTDCRLRDLADELGVHPARFKGRRRAWEIDQTHPSLVYEPGKCIACGLCIEVSRRPGAAEGGGLTFWKRGLGIEVRPPWGRDWGQTLMGDPAVYVAACPTGALGMRR